MLGNKVIKFCSLMRLSSDEKSHCDAAGQQTLNPAIRTMPPTISNKLLFDTFVVPHIKTFYLDLGEVTRLLLLLLYASFLFLVDLD